MFNEDLKIKNLYKLLAKIQTYSKAANPNELLMSISPIHHILGMPASVWVQMTEPQPLRALFNGYVFFDVEYGSDRFFDALSKEVLGYDEAVNNPPWLTQMENAVEQLSSNIPDSDLTLFDITEYGKD
jgi:hypothetical protein